MRISGGPITEPFDLGEILAPGLANDPDADALVSLTARWTWAQTERASNRLAASYRGLGLEPGDRLASLLPNRALLFIHYLACMKAGLVMVPLNYRYQASSIDHSLERSGARALVAHSERLAELAPSPVVAALPCGTITLEHETPDPRPRLEDLMATGDGAHHPVHRDPDDAAAIFFTSGSTGVPKGVTHSYRSLGAAFRTVAIAFELTPEDRLLPGSSCSHIGGFLFGFSALATGATVIVARRYTADEVLALMRAERPTVLCMIPAALFSVVRDPHAQADDFSSLRLCRAGADKVPMELEREFVAITGHEIDEGYGCSEAGLITLNPPSGLIIPGSVGRILPGFDAAIRDDAGNEVHFGVDGNLWVRSPTLMHGYWQDAEATNSALKDGWLDTGDRMTANDEGYLWFRGRKKQIIVHDGSNIFPQEVEDALLDHPAVASAGVIGIHDLVHGENVRAYVVLAEDADTVRVDELIEHARGLVGYKAPEEIVFIDEMPLNPTGKVDRVTLKAMAEERHHPD
ncbi:class I adenylate-forming enzyme family protein [Bauldia sp.]|uniref:class I adenylate-forming enzyme family protein n=1 Tax=Bauldia sp. TaxID=2575872 RepID=UPI003BAAF7B3